jgi:hypothetical protein
MCIFMFDRYIPRMVTKGRIFNFEIFEEATAKDQTPIGAGASTPETGHHRSTALIAPDYAYAQAKIDQARHWDDQGGGKTEEWLAPIP